MDDGSSDDFHDDDDSYDEDDEDVRMTRMMVIMNALILKLRASECRSQLFG